MNEDRAGKLKLAVSETCANIGAIGFFVALIAWFAYGESAVWMLPGVFVALTALIINARHQDQVTVARKAHNDAIRATATPPGELEAKTADLFAQVCRDLPKSLTSDKRSSFVGEKKSDKPPVFYVNLSPLGGPHANDLIARVTTMFTERGFEAHHWHMDGTIDWDYLVLTAPTDWVERLLVART